MCSSIKCPYPPQGRLTEIPRGRGVSKARFFKGKYEAKLEFLEGWERFNLKNLTVYVGGIDIFWNNTIHVSCEFTLVCRSTKGLQGDCLLES